MRRRKKVSPKPRSVRHEGNTVPSARRKVGISSMSMIQKAGTNGEGALTKNPWLVEQKYMSQMKMEWWT